MIDSILWPLKGAYTLCGLDIGADRHESLKGREVRPNFSAKFEREVSSHGVADEPDVSATVCVRELLNDSTVVVAETSMIQGWSEGL